MSTVPKGKASQGTDKANVLLPRRAPPLLASVSCMLMCNGPPQGEDDVQSELLRLVTRTDRAAGVIVILFERIFQVLVHGGERRVPQGL